MIELGSTSLHATLLPEKGCDIYGIVEPESGVDVLYKAPWGLKQPALAPWTRDSAAYWIQRYSGGWQILLPNAGDERELAGATLGFHGEAAVTAWDVEFAEKDRAAFSTRLVSAPLLVERRVSVNGSELIVDERVTNEGAQTCRFAWSHHPAFGAPLVGPGTRIATSARSFVADRSAPGTGLRPGAESRWPAAATDDGPLDLGRVPPDGEPRTVFGCLSDFGEAPWYAVLNGALGLGIELRWVGDVFSRAWYWAELRATQGYPWFGRGYAIAIEPSSVGTDGLTAETGIALEPRASRSVQLTLHLLVGDEVTARLEEVAMGA